MTVLESLTIFLTFYLERLSFIGESIFVSVLGTMRLVVVTGPKSVFVKCMYTVSKLGPDTRGTSNNKKYLSLIEKGKETSGRVVNQ